MTPNETSTPLCTEAEVTEMVHVFYARVRTDDVLGPVFDAAIEDWNHHLARLVDFWSAILLRTGRYTGAPMPKHAALPGLSPAMFERWLQRFDEVALELPNQAMAMRATEAAQRIARSLWYGYALSRDPQALPSELNHA